VNRNERKEGGGVVETQKIGVCGIEGHAAVRHGYDGF
jgi:hypothetical protein